MNTESRKGTPLSQGSRVTKTTLGQSVAGLKDLGLSDAQIFVTLEELVVSGRLRLIGQRTVRLGCQLSDTQADLGRGLGEWLFLAEGCRCTQTLSNDRKGPFSVMKSRSEKRLLLG